MEETDREHLKRRLDQALEKHDAADILERIALILDDESLDVFDCMEEIVELLSKNGIYTPRHNFG